MMKKSLVAFLLMVCLVQSPAFAHVQNEYTLYDDVHYSDAKETLLQLRALGVISYDTGASVFTPQVNLTVEELKKWSSSFLASRGIQSLPEGGDENATHADVVVAYFGDKAVHDADIKVELMDKHKLPLTKEQAVLLLGSLIERKDAEGLRQMAGFEEGPKGVISEVAKEKVKDGDSEYDVYRIVIDDTSYALSAHPKVLNGPAELEKWKGKQVVRTWIMTEKRENGKEEEVIHYMQPEKGSFLAEGYAPVGGGHEHHSNKDAAADTEDKEDKKVPWLLIVGVVFALLLMGILLLAKKR